MAKSKSSAADISPKLAALIDSMNAKPPLRELFEACVGLSEDQLATIRGIADGALVPAADLLDKASELLHRAQALTQLLYEFCAPGGDLQAGAIAVEQLDPETLHTNVSTLNGWLINAKKLLERAQGVPHG
jgi:hypothetical protein